MGSRNMMLALLLCLSAGASVLVRAEDPYIFLTWNVTYGTISPLGVPQQGILINGEFPGPNINSTTNNNLVINVFNHLTEPFLLTWYGIQQRKNSWQEGMPGTTCPIAPGTNYTYHFQVKDQIGSYFYHPSTELHRALGAFGGLHIHTRLLIPVPYADPEDEFTVLIGDWYGRSHGDLKNTLDSGRSLGRPSGVIINGKSKSDQPLFSMKPGKTYRYRVCNTGIKTSLNFRFQGHQMKLVETEGSHTVQNTYDALDIHVGQCYTVLVTADQKPMNYYLVASTRFLKEVITATAPVEYVGSKVPASPVLPEAPVGWAWSLNQFRTMRWNLSSSAARPNPQGSYHYGAINISRTIKFVNTEVRVDGKIRYAVNGVSHVEASTPLKLAEYYGLADKVFKYNLIGDVPPADDVKVTLAPNVLNITFRSFVEIIFENHENSIQTWHLDGYSFFPVAMEPGKWTPAKRDNYNLLDAVSRHTIQVYPHSWTAIMATIDNAGMWNLRSSMADRRYLGQQLYISVLSPEKSVRDEYPLPDSVEVCGIVKDIPRPAPYYV